MYLGRGYSTNPRRALRRSCLYCCVWPMCCRRTACVCRTQVTQLAGICIFASAGVVRALITQSPLWLFVEPPWVVCALPPPSRHLPGLEPRPPCCPPPAWPAPLVQPSTVRPAPQQLRPQPSNLLTLTLTKYRRDRQAGAGSLWPLLALRLSHARSHALPRPPHAPPHAPPQAPPQAPPLPSRGDC